MLIKAIKLDDAPDETLRVLNAVIENRRMPVRINATKVAASLGLSEGAVRYHLKKLVAAGYLSVMAHAVYAPTDKVIFLKCDA